MSAPAAAVVAFVVATVAIMLIYAGQCWLRPIVPCGACGGTGYGPSATRSCRWCGGTALRMRFGRRAFNYLWHLHRAGTPAARGRS